MAKSLRSKWKRKMRAIKRVRYGEKENKVLEKMVHNTEERKKLLDSVTENCKMLRCNVGNCVLQHDPKPLGDTSSTPIAADDDMDCTAKAKNYSSKTKRDEHGTYPAWMSKRKIQSLKSKPKNKTTKNIDGSSGRVCKKRRLSKGKRK